MPHQSQGDHIIKAPDGTVNHVEEEIPDTKADKANELLNNTTASVILTPENNKRVLRKIDMIILPIVLGTYFLQALDKASLAYSSVFGLVQDTHLVGHQYSWLGAIVYLAQVVAQPLVAYLLVRLPLGKFLATTVLFWGVALATMPAAHNFHGLLVSRLFLGLFEAGVAPTFIALTQMWWRRREQPLRLGAWYAMNGVTNMLGSLITYGLGRIDSPTLKSYQIIFLFFGLITVVYSLVVLLVPDSPMTAKFLNEEEKLIAVERLRDNQQGVENDQWKWSQAKEAVMDYKTWGWAFMMFAISIPSGGISTFGPLIIKAFGYNKFETILFNIPFGFVQLVATLGGALIATKIKMKSPVLAFLSLPPIAGCLMLLYIPRHASNKAPLLVAYYLISVYPGITPLVYSWSAGNTAGETKKKVTTGILYIFQSAGNVVGPNLYTTGEAPLYRRGLLSNLALFVVLIGLYAIQVLYLTMLNKRHAKKRVSMGKNAKIIDRSMMTVKQAYGESGEKAGLEEDQVQENSHAFEDKTDWENEDFVYVF